MADEDFKAAVHAYIELAEEIERNAKQSSELRKKKDHVAEVVLEYMKKHNVDECALATGHKVVRKTARRTEALKKEYIFDEIRELVKDDAKARAIIANIESRRQVVQKETLSKTKPSST